MNGRGGRGVEEAWKSLKPVGTSRGRTGRFDVAIVAPCTGIMGFVLVG
jgi:hypothetical protein